MVELPTWLKFLVYLNPISYLLDALRLALLGISQLPLAADRAALAVLPLLAVAAAAHAMARLRHA